MIVFYSKYKKWHTSEEFSMTDELLLQFKTLISTTNIASFSASEKCFATGDYTGKVVIYDYNGNPLCSFSPTSAYVNCLSFDHSGENLLFSLFGNNLYYASINGQMEKRHTHSVRVTKCAIDPEFKGTQGLSCVFSDTSGSIFRVKPPRTQLKSIFSQGSEAKEIASGEGEIDAIAWVGDIIAWASQKSVTLYRASKDEKITTIVPSPTDTITNSRTHPHILIQPREVVCVLINGAIIEYNVQTRTSTLLGKQENVLSIARTPGKLGKFYPDPSQGNNPTKFYVSIQKADETITAQIPPEVGRFDGKSYCSLVSHKDGLLLALNTSVTYVSQFSDSERVRHYAKTDISKALAFFRQKRAELAPKDSSNLLFELCEIILRSSSFDEAANVAKEFSQIPDWPMILSLFQKYKATSSIVSFIPFDQIELDSDIKMNTDLLMELAKVSSVRFNEVFKSIPIDKINPRTMITELHKFSSHDFNYPLMCLMHSIGNHDEAFQFALKEKDPGIFESIIETKSFNFPVANCSKLYQTYGDAFIDFLVDNMGEISPDLIMNQQLDPMFELGYLDKLASKNDMILQKYSTELVTLYLKFNSEKAMSFIQTNTYYDYSKALEVAKEYKVYEAQAHIVRVLGSAAEGMRIHLDFVKDPVKSIQYARDVDTPEVWQMLINHSYEHGDYLRLMMEYLPSLHTDPVAFIKGIKDQSILEDFNILAEKTIKEFRRKKTTAKLTHQIVARDAYGAFCRALDRSRKGRVTTF